MSDLFLTPAVIRTGAHALADAAPQLAALGQRPLLVTDPTMVRLGNAEAVLHVLRAGGQTPTVFDGVVGEPTDVIVGEALAAYEAGRCDCLVAVGGGSPLDTMKAVALLAAQGGDIAGYLGQVCQGTLPPMAAIPTTAGTGSETTQFTIITDTRTGIKMLLKGPCLLPQLAILDPDMTLSVPPAVTAATGIDALTHAIEAYTSRKAQPLTDTLAKSAIARIFTHLPTCFAQGDNAAARGEMAMAALEAGMAFGNASVTLVHGMSRPIGALFHVAHGLSNAMLLTTCLAYALPGCPERFADLGRLIGLADADSSDREAADAFLCGVCALLHDLDIPTPAAYGLDRAAFFQAIPKMAEDALASGSPGNTRRTPTQEDIEALYQALWEEESTCC